MSIPDPPPIGSDTATSEDALVDLQRRLLTLVAASGSLVGTPDLDVVLPATIRVASELVDADGYAVWRFDRQRREWDALVSSGVSPEFLERMRDVSTDSLPRPLPFITPLVVTDVQSEPELSLRVEAYAREGIRSVLVIPLRIRESWSGTLVFYCRERRVFSDVDVQTAHALGNLAAAAIATAELTAQRRRRQRLTEYLVEASGRLASTLDIREALASVAQLLVPHVADWCAVDLLTPSGDLERFALAHADPDTTATALDAERRWLSGGDAAATTWWVVRGREPLLIARMAGDVLPVAVVEGAARIDALRAAGLHSYLCVPVPGPDGAAGAVTLASSHGGRELDDEDLRFARDLASRIGMAVQNARAYDEARRANRVKDDFLATLSHELRTPLNAILGYVHMMRSGAVPPDRADHAMRVIERNATALGQIVADVLEVSRIAAGKLTIARARVDLTRVVQESIETMMPTAEEKGVALVSLAASDAVPIDGDADRLQQVMWNLLSNAIKFTPRGGRVSVDVARAGAMVRVVVRDSGVGIPPHALAHIFEPFHQADSRPAREFGGLGLGLAIVRRLVELHDGSIQVMSNGEGHGSEFIVTLPIRD
jgi:signal transduction histidine kinase